MLYDIPRTLYTYHTTLIFCTSNNSFLKHNTFLDSWKLSGITNASILTDGSLKTSEVCLADLTTTLCDELKNFNDSLDHSATESHIMLLRDVLMLYQEELHNLK